MVIRRFAHLILIASLSLLASTNCGAEEYVYLQGEGAIPPEPFVDDLEYGADDLEDRFGDSGADAVGRGPGSTDCPPIDKLLGEIKPAAAMSASIVSTANRPSDCSEGLFLPPRPGIARTAGVIQFNWQAPNFFHRPLYFDDTPLERYGQSVKHTCLQPFISGAKFAGTFAILPYKMGIDRIGDCVSPLGYYRPGSCAPCVRERIIPAIEADAALLEAGTALALILILP